MRNIAKFTKQDFKRFTTEPLILHPYESKTTAIAQRAKFFNKVIKEIPEK